MEKITIPEGITVLQLQDLRARYLKGLKSKDKRVRGYAAYVLGQIDPYEKESAAAIAKLLDEKDNWIRSMTAGAIGRYGKKAEFILPALRKAMNNENQKAHMRKKFQETIKAIEVAKGRTKAKRKRLNTIRKISRFRESVYDDREN